MSDIEARTACGSTSLDLEPRDEKWDAVAAQNAHFYRDPSKPTDEITAGGLELRFAVAPVVGIDVRSPDQNHDGSWTMSGYASVFNEPTTLYDGRFVKVTESVDSAAFDRCLREQGLDTPAGVVHFNPSHDMSRAVAATDVPAGEIGSLSLRPDGRGLFYLARVSRDDPDAVAMAAKMRIGVLKQASFAFTIAKAE
jgi:HK97 family phage prohead protease